MNFCISIFIAALHIISVIGQDLECNEGQVCQYPDDCDSYKTERAKLDKLKRGSSDYKALLAKLRKGVCNKKSRKVCCKSQFSTDDDPDSPSYVPREGECGLSGNSAYIVGIVIHFTFIKVLI